MSMFIRSYSFQKILDIPIIFTRKTNEFNLISLLLENLNEKIQKWLTLLKKSKKYNASYSKNIKFIISSYFLIISLQRFNRLLNKKNNSILIVEEYLDLRELFDNNIDNQIIKYKLKCTKNHKGK